jgi:hypothetical protein
MFGLELKERVLQKRDVTEIGIWAHSTYLDHCGQLEPGLSQVMLGLNTMELGSEFARSYKILNKIADDLIARKEINLNSTEYRGDGNSD